MIARYNHLSLLIGVPGIILQFVGLYLKISQHSPAGQPVAIVATILLAIGLAFYAKAIGRNPVWGFLGLLSIIGLLILASLKDLTIQTRTSGE
jgi:hypothetical protein